MPCRCVRMCILLDVCDLFRRFLYVFLALEESQSLTCGHLCGGICSAMFRPSISPWLLSVSSVPILFGSTLKRISRGVVVSCSHFPSCELVPLVGLLSLMIAAQDVTLRPVCSLSSLPPSCARMRGESACVASISILLCCGLSGLSLCLSLKRSTMSCSAVLPISGIVFGFMFGSW